MDLLKSHNLIQHNTPTPWISEWLWEHTCKSFANNSPAVNYLPSSHLSTQHHTKTLTPHSTPLLKVCTCVVLFLFVDRQFCQYCHEMLFFLIQQLILHIISFGSVWIIPTERPTDQPTEKQNIGKGTTTFTLLVDLVAFCWVSFEKFPSSLHFFYLH